MSPKAIQLGLLAFVSSAFAAPHAHGRVHGGHRVQTTGTGVVNDALATASTILTTVSETSTVIDILTVTATNNPAAASSTAVVSTVFASSVSAPAAQNAVSYSSPTTMATSVAVSSTAVAAVASSAVSSSPVAAASSSSSGSSSGGKRGLAYNDLQYTTAFKGTKVSWAYNWIETSGNLGSGFEYVPMLWGTASTWTSSWQSNAKAAIAAGTTHLLGFNEPDLPAQANLSPAAAATGYKTYMSDMFGGGSIRLGSPAVTNGAAPMGLTWLSSFLSACSGCQVDFVAIHCKHILCKFTLLNI
jgi:Glycosyl hydrolase catalytic core